MVNCAIFATVTGFKGVYAKVRLINFLLQFLMRLVGIEVSQIKCYYFF